MKRSIRLRLSVWMLAILVPVIAGGGWLLQETFGQRLQRDVDVALEEEAETIAELVASAAGPEAVAGLVTHVAADSALGAGKYVVVTRAGRLLAEAPGGARAVLEKGHPSLHVVRYDAPVTNVAIAIGVRRPEARRATQRLRSLLFIGVPLLLALAGGGLWVALGSVLRPLETAATALEGVKPSDLSVRIPLRQPEDEVGRLVTTLNDTLDRVERSMAELRRFSGDAAHALRTPLTVQRTGLEVALSKERSAGEYRAALADALASAERMSRIAERLLTLSRLDAADAPRERAEADAGEILHELADGFALGVPDKRGRIEVVAEPDLRVLGDVGDLYRLFSDLIDNALRYGDGRGTPAVSIKADRVDGWVRVEIADRGPGIDEVDLPRVFDRFYRGRSRPSADGGTGLGLSIALQIVRAHGGEIRIDNRSGGGCVATVRLPAAA